MRELVLMVRGSERMNVPSEKVQAYLDDGWTEVSRKSLESVPAEAALVATETPATEAAPVLADKPKGKGK